MSGLCRAAAVILYWSAIALTGPQHPVKPGTHRSAKSSAVPSRSSATGQRQVQLQLAKQLLQAGSHQEAISLLREVVREDSANADARLLLGSALALVPQRSEALEELRKAVQLAPASALAYYTIGPLRKASALGPQDRPALYQLCQALQKAGRTEEAERCHQKLSAMIQTELTVSGHMRDATAANNEGVELEKTGNLVAALEKYRAAVELDPSQTVFRRNLALALCRLGRWEDGIAELRKVLEANPEDVEATKALYIALENARAAKATRSGTEGAPRGPNE